MVRGIDRQKRTSRRCAPAGSYEEQPFAGARCARLPAASIASRAGSYEERLFVGARLRAMARGIDRQQGWPLQQNRSS
jgi:hypothetical protein